MIPLGGMSSGLDDQEIPEKITNSHYIGWRIMSFLFIATTIGCLVAFKIFDALIALMIGIWAYYMTKDGCKMMSQQCLFSFGMVCVIQAVMEFIIICMSLPGRKTQSTTVNGGDPVQGGSPHAAPSPFFGGQHSTSSSYTVTTKTVPFFSEEEGWHYNLQSAMMIASCVVFIIGALMTKLSYAEYPNSLFDVPESSQIGGGDSYGHSGGGGGGRYYGSGGPRPAASQNHGGGQRLGGNGGAANNGMFGGSGQRLGAA